MTCPLSRAGVGLLSTLTEYARLAVCLDVDGNLAPIVQSPQAASVPSGTQSVLRRLYRHDAVTLVLVSGRHPDDARRRCRGRRASPDGKVLRQLPAGSYPHGPDQLRARAGAARSGARRPALTPLRRPSRGFLLPRCLFLLSPDFFAAGRFSLHPPSCFLASPLLLRNSLLGPLGLLPRGRFPTGRLFLGGFLPGSGFLRRLRRS